MSNDCPGCLYRETVIQIQRIRIRMLEREIERLRTIISNAKKTCGKIADNADQVMSEHQPRGKWSFAKGALQAARIISRYLAC